MGVKKIRFPETSGIGIKPISREGTERLARAAIEYALRHARRSVTFVHKGNIMKFTEGAFREWGYALATREYRDRVVTERESWILGNAEGDAALSVEDNARAIDPGYDLMTPEQQAKVRRDVEARAGAPADPSTPVEASCSSATPSPTSRCRRRGRATSASSPPRTRTATTLGCLAAQVGVDAPGGNVNASGRHLRGDVARTESPTSTGDRW
jgi:hypothetical protein